MKFLLVSVLAAALAAPVAVSLVPTPAEAQVLAGRYAARAAERPVRPRLSREETRRLEAARDEVDLLEPQVEELENQTANLTPEQSAKLEADRARLETARMTVERLEAKLAR